jgi:plastocyanin
MARRSHRRQLVLPAMVAVAWLVLPGAMSFAGPEQSTGGTCSPDGTTLSITALDNKFDKDCLAVPADQSFTIDFNNLDRGIPHNVAIYEDDTARKTFFKGDLVDGPGKATYSVQGLPAGKWFFRCDPHPEMNGAFIVGNPPPS